MAKYERDWIFDVDPNEIKGDDYIVPFPTKSKYAGNYCKVNLSKCSVDNTVINRLIYTDLFSEKLSVFGKDGDNELTLAEIITEMDK